MTNPFPGARIRQFLARADNVQRFRFGLFSAQRAVVLAGDIIGGYADADRDVIDSSLESCWQCTQIGDLKRLSRHEPALQRTLIPETDGEYTFYNSATNDAVASLIYAVRAGVLNDAESSYRAAESLFNLADLALNRHRSDYVDDLAAAPITALAARHISDDLDRLQTASARLHDIRLQLLAEGRELSSLAD